MVHEGSAKEHHTKATAESVEPAKRQLTLSSVLIAMGLLSCTFAIAGPGKLPLADTLLLMASFGVAIGLWQQARDIGRQVTNEQPPGRRRALALERNWRYVLSVAVFVGWFLWGLHSQGVFGQGVPDWPDGPMWWYDKGVLMLVLTIGIASPMLGSRKVFHGSSTKIVHYLGCAAATGLVLVLALRDSSTIVALVHMAIRGIELAQPEPYNEAFFHGGVWQYETNVKQYSRCTVALGCAAFTNVAALIKMTSHTGGWKSRATYLASLLIGLALAVWTREVGFPSVSPVLAATKSFWFLDVWYQAGPLLLLFALAAGRRLTSHEECCLPRFEWRPAGKVYWSENWMVLGMTLVGAIGPTTYELYQFQSTWLGSRDWLSIAFSILESPPHYLHLAAALASAVVLIRRVLRWKLPSEPPDDVSISKLLVATLAVLSTTYLTLEACAACSFAYWIQPEELLWPLLP